MNTNFPIRTALRTGQSLHFHGEPGMTILATGGDVVVSAAPSWLGEQVVTGKTILHSGDAHLLSDRGWVAIAAHSNASVLCIPPTVSVPPGIGYAEKLALRIGCWWQSFARWRGCSRSHQQGAEKRITGFWRDRIIGGD